MIKLSLLVGLAGVDASESDIAQKWDKIFNFISLWIVMWLFILWDQELSGSVSQEEVRFFYLGMWFFFLLEVVSLSIITQKTGYYLLTNWMNLVILAIGLPLFFVHYPWLSPLLRLTRIFFVFGIMVPWLKTSLQFLTDNRLDTTILTAFIILILSGSIIRLLEPQINSISDGMWWAWVTISTVGYGDITPKTPSGRLFGGFLILIGMGLFSIITANFAALFIQRSREQFFDQTVKRVKQVRHEEKLMEDKLDEILLRLDKIEQGQKNMRRHQKEIHDLQKGNRRAKKDE